MITVIDYGAGNLRSVENALRHLEAPYRITSQPGDIAEALAILLPGVGHFGQMMRSLQVLGITQVLREAILKGVPYLGICLGMHALFEGSEEAPENEGLGIFSGSILRFPQALSSQGLKVPHMGWNQVRVQGRSRLFDEIGSGSFFYFAHSYYLPVEPSATSILRHVRIAGLADYGFAFVSAIETENIFGVQFHPEKSGQHGMQCFANFVRASKDPARRESNRSGNGAG